jgi:hypothetical protein
MHAQHKQYGFIHFEAFLYFSKHSIQIKVGEKNHTCRTNFVNVKIGLLKRKISETFQ